MADIVEENVTKPIAPQTRRGAKTRASLVRAAKQIFERDGFLNARITDISKRAGVSHGAYYHYFTSKEQLFREVAEIQEERLTAPHDDPELTHAHDDSPMERIRKANRRYLLRYREEAPIMGVIEQVSRYDAPVNEVRMARQKQFAERSERAIRRWQREGIADPGHRPSSRGRRARSHGRALRGALAGAGLSGVRLRSRRRAAHANLGQRAAARGRSERGFVTLPRVRASSDARGCTRRDRSMRTRRKSWCLARPRRRSALEQ